MKKSLIIILTLIFSLTACSQNVTRISLNQLSDNYSLDDVKSDNCVVFEDGDITYGQPEWDSFIKKIENGKSATVRLGFYYTLGDPSGYSEEYYEEIKDDYPILFINDLSFDGREYIIESIEDGQLMSKEYKYLLKYDGQPRVSAVFSKYTYYVLVNDNTVTWDDIEHGMLSSKFGDFIDHYRVYSDLEIY
jgi:hypothetical protein